MLETRRLTGAIGAEILALDLSRPLDAATASAVERALDDHVVLVFRDQRLEPAAQIAFTEIFGAVEPHPLRTRRTVDGFPGVLVLENRPGRPGARNDYWHSDISHAERPPRATFLHAIAVPEGRGDTMFCNMRAAYEGLSPGLRRALDGVRAMHSGEPTMRRAREASSDALPIESVPPPRAHPAVRTIPATGRRSLFVNPHFTIGFEDMTEAESRSLLDHLYAFATRPENVYRHRWRAGDLVVWDNRCAMHYAVYDYDDTTPRLMHRTTAAGDRPA